MNRRIAVKLLLFLHLFVFLVWLSLLRTAENPDWFGHVVLLSLLGIQFSWGLTVGLMIGPGRKRRPLLWFSLLPIFLPGTAVGIVVKVIYHYEGPITALIYLAILSAVLACETFGGVMLGAKLYNLDCDE